DPNPGGSGGSGGVRTQRLLSERGTRWGRIWYYPRADGGGRRGSPQGLHETPLGKAISYRWNYWTYRKGGGIGWRGRRGYRKYLPCIVYRFPHPEVISR